MTSDAAFDVVVVVPAHDEADRIDAAIESIAIALRAVGGGYLVVVDDASRDRTTDLARDALARTGCAGSVVRIDAGCASVARTAGVEWARSFTGASSATVLLSTDADTIVPAGWATAHLDHHRLGEVAVAGVVELIDDEDSRPIIERWSLDYGATIDDDATHPHVHAANLSVRLDVYDAVGGFGSAPRAEDIDLWRRLRDDGHHPVADASIVVHTSARRAGRVAEGFAHALDRLYGDRAADAVNAS